MSRFKVGDIVGREGVIGTWEILEVQEGSALAAPRYKMTGTSDIVGEGQLRAIFCGQARQQGKSPKPPLSLVLRFPTAMAGLARALAYGDKKHGGFKAGKACATDQERADSLLRHLSEVLNGNEIDEESGLRHRDLVLSNAVFLGEAKDGA